MPEKAQSFNPFDMSKVLSEFDPSKMMNQVTKAFSDYKVPGLDMSAVIEHQRKNIEALTTANRQALEGLQAIAMRQSEILRQTMDEAVAALKDLSSSEGPTEAASKQAQLLGKALEKALTNMRELAEMATKSNTEAFEVVKTRMTESVEEIKQLARKMPGQQKA
ncbi:MAG: phasin family protein [Gammaproteobacteria bacterium]|jgi:phasin family protein